MRAQIVGNLVHPFPRRLACWKARGMALLLAALTNSQVGPLLAQDLEPTLAPVVTPADPSVIVPDVPPADVQTDAMPAEQGTWESFETMPAPPAAFPAPLFGGPLDTRPKLTGDWNGLRPELAESGIAIDGNVAQFYQGVASGGISEGAAYGGHADYYLNVDGQKAGLWPGLFITLHAETVFGDSANGLTGALLPVSFIQMVPKPNESATALTAVKITQALSQNFVTYFGRLNPFDDFHQQFASGRGVDAFMNTAFLFNPVMARQVPYCSYGAGAAYLVEGQPVAALAVFDATDHTTTSGFDSFFTNGAVLVGQVIVPTSFFGLPGHQSVGFSYSSGSYRSIDRSSYLDQILTGTFTKPKETGSASGFYQFDQTVMTFDGDPARSWGVFGNAGIADDNPSPIRWFANLGVGGSSPIESRPLDTFGMGYFYLGVSNSLKEFAPNLIPVGNEHGVEFFYNYAATPWLRISPDLQIVTPALERVDTAVILGLRAKIVF